VRGTIAAGDYLLRNDILVVRILQTSTGDRPVYFASTTGTYEKFNIQPWMVRQGVAYELVPSNVEPTDSTILLPPQARFQAGRMFPFWVDLDRTRALLDEYYVFRDLTERTFWPDLSTNGIPLQYYQAYTALATAYMMRGEMAESNQAIEEATKFVEVALGPISPRAREPSPSDLPTQPAEPLLDTGGAANPGE
jgi:hypothetical protein